MIKFSRLIKTVSLCSVLVSGLSFADELPSIKTTMFLEQEGFLMWYAKEQGWDKELGIDIKLEISRTNGVDVMNKHREDPDVWNITAASSIPFIIGSSNMDLKIIGMACDDGPSTSVMVRKDSDIFKVKGYNRDFPEIYGSPDTIKGKTFLVKGISSGAYTLAAWLDIFNLNFSSVVIKDITGPEILKEMENKNVEGAGLWSPDTYESEYLGYQKVTTAANIDEYIPIMFLADNNFLKDNEDTVAKFLAVYIRAVEKQREDAAQLVPSYQRFLKQYTGRDFSESICLKDLKDHRIYTLNEQLSMFEAKDNKKSEIHKIQRALTAGLMLIMKDMPSQNPNIRVANHLKDDNYITDYYLRLAKKYSKY